MQITLNLVAESAEDLRHQLLTLLGSLPVQMDRDNRNVIHDYTNARELVSETKSVDGSYVDHAPMTTKSPDLTDTKETKTVNGRGPKGPGPKKAAPVAETGVKAPDATGAELPPTVTTGSLAPDPRETKAALALKESVIATLMAAWAAGKVTKVRTVLSQYGSGAKSFREIDIQDFPAIDEAIQAGALA